METQPLTSSLRHDDGLAAAERPFARRRTPRGSRWAGDALILLALGVSGCSDETDAVGSISGCIVGGDVSDHFLFMSDAEADAIVRVEVTVTNDHGSSFHACSGVLLSLDWVLTARHCAPDPGEVSARVHFGAQPVVRSAEVNVCGVRLGTKLALDVQTIVSHPELDLLLLKLGSSPASSGLEVVPIPHPAAENVAVGQPVQIAGFGRSGGEAWMTRHFAVEEISGLTAAAITVDGRGRSGACDADSGGPMLSRGPSGTIVALGVLSVGSASCVGSDEYVRLAHARDWLEAYVAPQGSPLLQQPCGGLNREGRCYEQTAIWCDGQVLQAQTCLPGGLCGWNADAHGYRCVAADEDPCQGVSPLGRCDGDIAVRCASGALERSQCVAGHCVRSSTTGIVACER